MTTSKWAMVSVALMAVSVISGLIASWPWWATIMQLAFIGYMTHYAVKHRRKVAK